MLKLLGKSSVVVGERKLQTVKRIAEGGFSIVYLVRQTTDADKGKLFALKIVICQTDEQVEAARREMRVHTSCKHPNVLTLIDFDVVQNKNNRGHRDALFLFPFVFLPCAAPPSGMCPGASTDASFARRAPTPLQAGPACDYWALTLIAWCTKMPTRSGRAF